MADRRKQAKLTWGEYEKIAKENKTTTGKKKRTNTPSFLTVQRMSSEPLERLKKYEPLETREFVDFTDYDNVTIENVKDACEKHYNAPAGSCDVLLGDKGPSCYLTEQIAGKKIFYVRFINPGVNSKTAVCHTAANTNNINKRGIVTARPKANVVNRSQQNRFSAPTSSILPPVPSSIIAKSVSVADLLMARKLVKPPNLLSLDLVLETYDCHGKFWKKSSVLPFSMEKEKFAEGSFRDAFKAKCKNASYPNTWVIKQFKEKQAEKVETIVKISLENHTRKQVQMHSVAKKLAEMMAKKVPLEFGETFKYDRIYFSKVETKPVTVEEFVPGACMKFINNDGTISIIPEGSGDSTVELCEKAETFSHFTYSHSNQEMIVLDIQGNNYNLYDPEIATTILIDDDDDGEMNFCAGNLSSMAIENFFGQHICSKFCQMLDLPTVTLENASEYEDDVENH